MNAKRQKAIDLCEDQLAKARALREAAQVYIGTLEEVKSMILGEDKKATIKNDTSNTIDVALTRAMLTKVKQDRDAVVALTIAWPAQDPEETITSAV